MVKRQFLKKFDLKSVKFFYKSVVKNPKRVINRAIINTTPLLKIKQLNSSNKRSQLKEFPYIVKAKNRIPFALKFFLNKTKSKNESGMHERLVTELLAMANNSGVNIINKKNLYEYAFMKKKYFYYRWF